MPATTGVERQKEIQAASAKRAAEAAAFQQQYGTTYSNLSTQQQKQVQADRDLEAQARGAKVELTPIGQGQFVPKQTVDAGLASQINQKQQELGITPVQQEQPKTQAAPTDFNQFQEALTQAGSLFQQQASKVQESTQQFQQSFNQGLQDIQSQINAANEQFQNAFKILSSQQQQAVQSTLSNLQQQGINVDLNNPQLQEELATTSQQGNIDYAPILSKYTLPEQQLAQQTQGQISQSTGALLAEAERLGAPAETLESIKQILIQNPAKAQEIDQYLSREIAMKSSSTKIPDTVEQFTRNDYGEPVKIDVGSALSQFSGRSLSDVKSQFSQTDLLGMSSGDLLGAWLQNALGSAELIDESTKDYLTSSAVAAKATYEEGLRLETLKKGEIDKIIDGKDIVPTTYEGLAAKVLADTKNMQTESIKNQQQYQKEQFDIQMKRERDNRSRLEGYLKAKLASVGALDSSAGLQTLAVATNAADLRLQQMESQYSYAEAQLNLESRQVMTNFANNIVKMTIDGKTAEQNLQDSYSSKILEISKERIASEQEKIKLQNDLLGQFIDKKTALDSELQQRKFQEEQFAFQKLQANLDQAYKTSGITGSYYYYDSNTGQMVDSGVPTFDAKKWQETQHLNMMQFQHSMSNDAWSKGLQLLDQFGTGIAPQIEQIVGLPQGSLSGLKDAVEMQQQLSEYQNIYEYGGDVQAVAGTLDYLAGAEKYGDQKITLGIPDVDPVSIPTFRTGLAALDSVIAKVTQGFDTPVNYLKGRTEHGGYDIVFKDGQVHSLTNGTITEVIPDPNPGKASGWGGRVVVEDEYGNKYQYAHFVNGQVGVQVGQKIRMGESLGSQGSAGNSTGPHADIRLIQIGNPQKLIDPNLAKSSLTPLGLGVAGGALANIFNIGAHLVKTVPGIATTGGSIISKAIGNYYINKESTNPQAQQYNTQMEKALTYVQPSPEIQNLYTLYQKGDSKVLNVIPSEQRVTFLNGYQNWLNSQGSGKLASDYQSAITATATNLTLRSKTDSKAGLFSSGVSAALKAGDLDAVKQLFNTQIEVGMDATAQSQFIARNELLATVNKIKNDLTEYERLNGNTGYFKGKIENLYANFGQVRDPKLRELGQNIALSIQAYRKSISGAAFTEAESKEYFSIFPSIDKVKDLNAANINAVLGTTKTLLESTYRRQLGDKTFDLLYSEDFASNALASRSTTDFLNLIPNE